MARSVCKVDGCDRFIVGSRLCNLHYRRMRRHGDPLGGRKTYYGEVATFLREVLSAVSDECIPWPFAVNGNGYGSIGPYETYGTKYPHVYVCEQAHGPKPTERSIACHAPVICHNRLCVNPAHIRWATHSENAYDMVLDGTHWWKTGLPQKGSRDRG